MDLIDKLKSAHSFHGDPLHREAWEEIERLREALQNIADGPRDVEKSYVSLLHEVQSEARDAIAKATGGE